MIEFSVTMLLLGMAICSKRIRAIPIWVAAIIGTIANLVPIGFYFLGCAISQFTCTGDGMGGAMMGYMFSFFIPNAIIVLFCFTLIIGKCLKSFLTFRRFERASVIFYGFTVGALIFLVGFESVVAHTVSRLFHR